MIDRFQLLTSVKALAVEIKGGDRDKLAALETVRETGLYSVKQEVVQTGLIPDLSRQIDR